jgi:hypothetical protein
MRSRIRRLPFSGHRLDPFRIERGSTRTGLGSVRGLRLTSELQGSRASRLCRAVEPDGFRRGLDSRRSCLADLPAARPNGLRAYSARGVEGSSPFVRSREAALPPGQIVGGHFPSTYVASESPGQGGMETQMNVRSASPVFRY